MTTTSRISRASQPSIYKVIGARIREKRLAANITQADLAERIGTNRPALTLVESGQQKCAVHELLAIAKALGIPVCSLLSDLEATR